MTAGLGMVAMVVATSSDNSSTAASEEPHANRTDARGCLSFGVKTNAAVLPKGDLMSEAVCRSIVLRGKRSPPASEK